MHTVRLPHIGALLAIRAADYANFLGNHKAGIKADAKLADNIDVIALMVGILFLELFRSGMCNRTEVFIELVLCHTDTVIADGNGSSVFIKRKVDCQSVRYIDVFFDKALKGEFVKRVRSIGNELAQEDLAIGIDGVDHEIKQLLAFGLKLLHR